MNRGNEVKCYRKWLFSLPVIKKSRDFDGVSFELRQVPDNNELVFVRYEDGIYDSSSLQSDWSKEQFDEMLKNCGLD